MEKTESKVWKCIIESRKNEVVNVKISEPFYWQDGSGSKIEFSHKQNNIILNCKCNIKIYECLCDEIKI